MQRYSIRTIIYSQESIIYLARVCHGMEWNAEVYVGRRVHEGHDFGDHGESPIK